MKAIFLCAWKDGQPDIPPMDAETGPQLHFHENGQLAGGYSLVSDAPPEDGKMTCFVWVWAAAAVITAMMEDTERYPYSIEVIR